MDGKSRAEQLIAEERERKTGFLDLGMLALTEIPDSLCTLEHLKSLNLGDWYWDSGWNHTLSNNGFSQNDIGSFALLKQLPRLRSLFLSGLALDNLYEVAQIASLETLDFSNTKVSDLTPLASLSALQSLDCSFTKVSDLTPLESLSALQSLYCFETQVSDLTPLASLSALQSLHFSGTDVFDLIPLASLSALRSLDCSSSDVSDLTPLESLSALQSLYCSLSDVSDLTPLESLSALQSLDCFKTDVFDLTPLASLSALQSLNCCGTDVSDLTPLASLSALRSLNCSSSDVSDLTPLEPLSALQSLDCSWTQVSDLTPIASLSALQSLRCSATQVSDLTPLESLSALQRLDCAATQVSDLTPITGLERFGELFASGCKLNDFPKQLLESPTLQDVNLQEARVPGVPQEILAPWNCLQELRDHVADLSSGTEPVRDVKLIVLGNGKVGKTQICRRLRGLSFDESVPSTHGITIDCVPLSQDDESPILNTWDFGGQEIYHGTHALFMATRAVFVVVWHPEFERNDEVQEGGYRFRNHALPYWVDYVRNLGGTHSPLILVQTRCERPEDEKPSPPIDSSKLDFTYVKSCTYSARVDRGRATLDDAISQAVEYLQKNEGIASIGKGRMAVLRQLQDWRKQDQERLPEEREHRTLSYKEFEALCEQKGGVRSAASLLDYLHQIGALFFKKELFDGRIILDQSWALDAIYTVFDREHAYQHLCRQHGRFTRDLLEILVWGDYSQDEQKLFLSLMQSCGICFIHKPEDKRHGVEAEYIAPDLLPDKQGVADRLVGRWDDKEPFVEVCYHYRFLHPGIIRSLLSEIGKHAQTAAEYWKYGAWLFDARSNARALVEQTMQVTGEGEIRFQVQNDRNGELTKWLREKLEELNQRSSSYQPVIGIDGQQSPTRADERVQKRIPIEEEPESDKTRARDHIEDAPETSTPNFGPLPRSQTSQPRIFVSYAWDDPAPEGKHREAIVDRLCQAMQERGIEIIRDKTHLKLGESVREFMDQIADGDFIVAVISDKYLRSSYCMYELFQIYRRCADNPKRFNHKLIPLILQDAQISDLPSSAQYVQVWKKQKEQLDQVMKEIGHDYLDEATIREYRLINEFGHNVLPILHLLRDRMIPRDLDRMAEEGFQEVLKLTGLA